MPSNERFTGPDSIYSNADGPAPTAYNTTDTDGKSMGASSVLVPSFEKSQAERFSGPDSIYRKGLRKSSECSECSELSKCGVWRGEGANDLFMQTVACMHVWGSMQCTCTQ